MGSLFVVNLRNWKESIYLYKYQCVHHVDRYSILINLSFSLFFPSQYSLKYSSYNYKNCSIMTLVLFTIDIRFRFL